MKERFVLRRTILICFACAFLIFGMALSRFSLGITPAMLPVLAILCFASRKISIIFVVCLSCLFFCAGLLRGQSFMRNVDRYDDLNGQKVSIIAVADSDSSYNERKQLQFDISNIETIQPKRGSLVGKMQVSGFVNSNILKGDIVQVTGKMYKTRGSKLASISFAEVKVISMGDSKIDEIRRSFGAGLSNVLPDPEAPLGLGLLIGQKSGLSQESAEWLKMVGLTHIIAVSGYNLTIIVRFVHRLMSSRSRYQTVLLSTAIIGLFLMMTGFSASIVRASIVCGLSLLAWYYGRKFKPMVIILMTGAITAFWYPVYVWFDIGWYLSFLAFFGVLVLAPTISRRYFAGKAKPFTMLFIESFCAQLMTLPIILYVFGESSWVALLANLLVVPLVPFAMLATLIAGIIGMVAPTALVLLSLPAKLTLTYIIDVTQRLASFPSVQFQAHISFASMIACYAGIIVLVWLMNQKTSKKHAIITDENLI